MLTKFKIVLILLIAGFVYQPMVQAKEKVTIFAAASLSNALEEIAQTYQISHDVQLVTSFASSSTLARQIVQGAPVDLFISADQNWMDYLQEHQVIQLQTRRVLLTNTLVLIAEQATPHSAITLDRHTDWLGLLHGERLAVGDPDHVPAGIYAKQALTALGVWQELEPRLARAENVRSALLLVERGEAPLGIVYGSDAKASQQVKVIAEFAEETHTPVEYPVALLANSQSQAAIAFLTYLSSPAATTVFERYGFRIAQ